MNFLSIKRRAHALLAALCLAMVGCDAGATSQQLVGKWRGRPDTYEEKRRREFAATGAEPAPSSASPVLGNNAPAATGSDDQAARSEPADAPPPKVSTDLEAFDFEVLLEFRDGGGVLMTLDGGDPIEGAWRVLSSEVGLSIIEITAAPLTDRGAIEPVREKRHYELEWTPDGEAFTLREEGADPQFGWLYFQRIE